jgi:hypothetical protein
MTLTPVPHSLLQRFDLLTFSAFKGLNSDVLNKQFALTHPLL